VTTNQSRIGDWVRSTLGEDVARNIPERALRAAEEVIELAQACNVPAETLHRLVDYVFSRPAGKAYQEIGGSMVTLYAAAEALKLDADVCLVMECERIETPEVIERCRRRQLEKSAARVTGT
jgi:hypothetical protein